MSDDRHGMKKAMTADRHRMKKAMMAFTVTTFVFLGTGAVVPLIMNKPDFTFLCFVVVGVAMLSVRHVLRAIDRRLTSLEQEAIDRRAAEHEKQRAD